MIKISILFSGRGSNAYSILKFILDNKLKFAVNHRSCPQLSPLELIDLAVELGISAIELRTDIKENSITDMAIAKSVAKYALKKNIKILTINALYPFNIWNKELEDQAEKLADLCQAASARGLVCCPLVSDTTKFTEDEQIQKATEALKKISPILKSRGLVGHVEALGFSKSSLRKKKLALEAIDSLGMNNVFDLLHDNFHHAAANETEYHAKRTGFVHIYSVFDQSLDMEDLQDSHRFFVQDKDITFCIQQIQELIKRGYNGYFSLEPFADEIWGYSNPLTEIRASMDYIIEKINS